MISSNRLFFSSVVLFAERIALRNVGFSLILFAQMALVPGPALCASVSDSVVFDVNHAITLAGSALRPRSQGSANEAFALRAALRLGDRKQAFSRLRERVRGFNNTAPDMAMIKAQESRHRDLATGRSIHDYARRISDDLIIKNIADAEARNLQEAAFVAWVDDDAVLTQAVAKRALALATLDSNGITGAKGEELSAANVTITLALVLDWHYATLGTDQRKQILAAISPRMTGLVERITKGPRALTAPVADSHSTEIAGAIAETAALTIGETPLATQWAQRVWPIYAATLSRWGGDDGGFANGTAYASWDVGAYTLRHLDTLRRAAGINLFANAWMRNFGRYLVYMLPPGTPINVFGDAAERSMQEDWARYANAYALRVNAPLYGWYARQWFQQDNSRLELLTAPLLQTGNNDWPEGTPHSAHFPSIGWVGMHSDLRDRGRVSLYFKSSPYGSTSHSHADQNSFTVVSGGRPLMIDSGYYDAFGSNHHFSWTRQTMAHNAITFDQGVGQGSGTRQMGDAEATGMISQYDDSGSVVLTTGDATRAYKGSLSKAVRSIAYLRPKTIVVFDALDSPAVRTFEWNLHAIEQAKTISASQLEIANGDERLCVDFHADSPFAFSEKRGFPATPLRDDKSPRSDQWHGVFSTTVPIRASRFVAVLRVGCGQVATDIKWSKNEVVATIDGTRLVFDGVGVK
jgi:hypothetical protein